MAQVEENYDDYDSDRTTVHACITGVDFHTRFQTNSKVRCFLLGTGSYYVIFFNYSRTPLLHF
jgi:hypothetical protein